MHPDLIFDGASLEVAALTQEGEDMLVDSYGTADVNKIKLDRGGFNMAIHHALFSGLRFYVQ